MGTRSGDVDPAVLEFIAAKEGMSLRDSIDCSTSNPDCSASPGSRRTCASCRRGSGKWRPAGALAIDIFCYRVRKYLGAYLAAMNGADAIVFAGGIGENSPDVRARDSPDLDWLGIRGRRRANKALVSSEGRIDAEGSRLELWVIPTDEELLIARDTWRVVTGADVRG